MRNLTINGRLAQDVTKQLSKSGQEFINFSIASTEFGDPKSEDGKPITQWYRVTSFQPNHINMANHLKKGKPIIVTGRYSNRLYQSNNGQYGISNEIIALDISFEIGSEMSGNGQSNAKQQTNEERANVVNRAVNDIPQASGQFTQKATMAAPVVDTQDDDLPF